MAKREIAEGRILFEDFVTDQGEYLFERIATKDPDMTERDEAHFGST